MTGKDPLIVSPGGQESAEVVHWVCSYSFRLSGCAAEKKQDSLSEDPGVPCSPVNFNEGFGMIQKQFDQSISQAQINWLLPQMLNRSCMKNRPSLFDLPLYSRPRESGSHLPE